MHNALSLSEDIVDRSQVFTRRKVENDLSTVHVVAALERHGRPTMSMDLLMDALKSRRSNVRSWSDTTKELGSVTLGKQYMDVSERPQLQDPLDILQKQIKVNGTRLLVERLQAIAHSLGLRSAVSHSGCDLTIHSSLDVFRVQIQLKESTSSILSKQKSGDELVRSVTVSKNNDSTICPELKKSLNESDFEEFRAHLTALIAMYNINGDSNQKHKACVSIQALEDDLNTVAQIQSSINCVSTRIHRSPLGVLQPRIGGRPMKLVYFVSPYDLLDAKQKSTHEMTEEVILRNGIGHSLTIGVQSSPVMNRLQVIPLATVNKTTDGKTLPSFQGISELNSCLLPAVFVLCLDQPLSMSVCTVTKITAITGVNFTDTAESRPLLSEYVDTGQGLDVRLSDQHHRYFIYNMEKSMNRVVTVHKIPFTNPTQVPKILVLLRQQVLFNTVLTSCVRNHGEKKGEKERVLAEQEQCNNNDAHAANHSGHPIKMDSILMFEVTPLSLQHITVMFEHPIDESIATVEVTLSDMYNLKCRLCGNTLDISSNEEVSKIMHRSLSLPVMMRALFKKAKSQLDVKLLDLQQQAAAKSAAQSAARQQNPPAALLSGTERRLAFIQSAQHARAHARMDHLSGFSARSTLAGLHNGPGAGHVDLLENFDTERHYQQLHGGLKRDPCRNPMLVSLLDQQGDNSDCVGSIKSDSQHNSGSMLSSLLEDGESANSNNGSPLSTNMPQVMMPGGMPLGGMPGNIAGVAAASSMGRTSSNMNHQNIPTLPGAKPKKPRKRKSSSDLRAAAGIMAARNTKRKTSQDSPLLPSPGMPGGLDATLFEQISPPSGGVMIHQNSIMHQPNAMHHSQLNNKPSYAEANLFNETVAASRLETMIKQEKLNQEFSGGGGGGGGGDVFLDNLDTLPPKLRKTSESPSKTPMLAELLEDSGESSTNGSLLQSSQRDSASFLASKSPAAVMAANKNKTVQRMPNEFKSPNMIKTEPGVRPTDLPSLTSRMPHGHHHGGSGTNTPTTPPITARETPSPQHTALTQNLGLGDLLEQGGAAQRSPASNFVKQSSVQNYINASSVPDVKPINKSTNSSQFNLKNESNKYSNKSDILEGKTSPVVKRMNIMDDYRSSPTGEKSSKKSSSSPITTENERTSAKKDSKSMPAITMKINTKDNKTFVKSLSDNSSSKFSNKDSSSSRMSGSKNKVVKSDTYTFVADEAPSLSLKSISATTISTSSLKLKKYKSEEMIRLEKKRYSKNLASSGDSKRKRDEGRKDSGKKKRKIRSGQNSSVHSEHPVEANRTGEEKISPITIKIGKRNSSSSSASRSLSTHSSSKNKSPSSMSANISTVSQATSMTSSVVKSSHSSKSQLPSAQSKSSKLLLNASKVNRSKSEPGTNVSQLISDKNVSEKSGEKKSDQKLKSTPTIKLKPLPTHASTTASNTSTTNTPSSISATKVSESTSPAITTSASVTSSSSNKNKPAAMNARRSSLTAIVDKLKTKQQTTPEIASLPDKKELEKLARKDPMAMDNIRHQILMAGATGAPSKDVMGSLKSFRKTSVSDPRKTDMTTKSVLGSKPPTTTASQYGSMRPGYSAHKATTPGSKTAALSISPSLPNNSHNTSSGAHPHIGHADSMMHSTMHNKSMPSKSGMYGNNMSGRQPANNVHSTVNSMHSGVTMNKQLNSSNGAQQSRGPHGSAPSNVSSRKMPKTDDSSMTRHFLDAVSEQDQQSKQTDSHSGGDGGRANGDSRTNDMRGPRTGGGYRPNVESVNHKSGGGGNTPVPSRTSNAIGDAKVLLDNKENARIQITENKPTEIRAHPPKPRADTYDSKRTLAHKHGTITLVAPMSPDDGPSSPEDGLVIDVPGPNKDSAPVRTVSPSRSPASKAHLPKISSHIVYSAPIQSPVGDSGSPVSDSEPPKVPGGTGDDDDLMDAAIML